MRYFDAHCHIQFPHYDEDSQELLAKMREGEVGGLVVGVDRESSEKAIATTSLSTAEAPLYATVGLHPNHDDESFAVEAYKVLAVHPKVVAIGECGLDYYRPEDAESAKGSQKESFLAHIELAAELDKPLMLHIRPSKGTMNAYDDALEMLIEARAVHGDRIRGNSHFHTGDLEVSKRLIDLGFTCSFTAVLTFTADYDEVVRTLPLESILTETDSPYVAPADNRGKRNDPLAVHQVVAALARIRGVDEEVIRRAALLNAVRIFKLGSTP
ncbi:MAG: TatD family hydrolase [Minisyncoccia bacterium]